MLIRVIAAGKLRDPGLERLCTTYVRRTRPFASLELAELRSLAAVQKRLHADKSTIHIVLDERGAQIGTREFSAWIEAYRARAARTLAFYIGDAHGFTDRDRDAADRLMALSRLTLPHRLVRVMLLEQIYRATSLLAGHPYHHD